MNPTEIIQKLPKYVQALYSDGTLYWSGDETIATRLFDSLRCFYIFISFI